MIVKEQFRYLVRCLYASVFIHEGYGYYTDINTQRQTRFIKEMGRKESIQIRKSKGFSWLS